MSNKKIYIIHKRGAKRHFEAIENIKDREILEEKIYLELNFLKKFIKGIVYLKPGYILRSIRNLFLFMYLICSFKKKIILSLEPFDPLVIFADILAKKNGIIFFSSWPFWNGDRLPQKKKLLREYLKEKWASFMSKANTVTVTEAGKKSMDKFMNQQKTEVIPHCVNRDNFYPKKNYLNVGEKIHILFVGRIIKCKGILQIKQLIKEMDKDKYFFNIVGDGKNRDLIEDVFERENVKYYGKINNKDKLTKVFRNNDVLILPSYREDTWEELFGIVLIEAMASGLAIVATNCIGPKEIIEDKKNGLLIEQKNYKQLKEAIGYLQRNKENLRSLKKNSYEMSKKYSVKSCSEKWRKEINKL